MRRSAFDWILEAVCLVFVLAGFGVAAICWPELPARIPRHFGASGLPDGWSGKAFVWFVPAASAALYAFLTFASRHQALVNLPFPVDRENPEVKRQIAQFLTVLKTVETGMLFYISCATVQTALHHADGLGRIFLPVVLAAIAVPTAAYLLMLKRTQAPLG